MKLSSGVALGLRGPEFISSDADLARAMQIEEKDLVWYQGWNPKYPMFAYGNHYIEKHIPKARGGSRLLLVPKPRLKAIQRWILAEILSKIDLHPAAHGFRPGRSILTNAAPHMQKNLVICLDLRDFFPTITWARVAGLFEEMGYKPEVARTLALLCTTRDPKKYRRCLPQGAPTSPAISNLIARKLDSRLQGLATKLGFTYTRYADDCTFSGKIMLIQTLLKNAREIIMDEGFKIHPDKLRIHRKGHCHRVTGLVVNQKLAVPRTERRKIRAILHKAKFTGLEKQNLDGHEHFVEHLRGKIAFIRMVNRAQAVPLQKGFEAVGGKAGRSF